MRRTFVLITLVWLAGVPTTVGQSPPGEPQAREAAGLVGDALMQADASVLRPLLPDKGKVQLRLRHLGVEDGAFGPSQVRALLQEFLDHGSVDSYELVRVEHDPGRLALAHARAAVVDASGRRVGVDLHLTFQPEGGRWVLREIREAGR